MGKVFSFLKMETNTKDRWKMDWDTAEELITGIMEVLMKENGRETETVEVFTLGLMDVGSKGSGKVITYMENVFIFMLMGGQKNENMWIMREWTERKWLIQCFDNWLNLSYTKHIFFLKDNCKKSSTLKHSEIPNLQDRKNKENGNFTYLFRNNWIKLNILLFHHKNLKGNLKEWTAG